MTDVIKFDGKGCYVDRNLRVNLDDMKADVMKDDDIVLVIDGKERVGKSVLAMVIGWYFSEGNLKLDSICMTPEDFKERVRTAKKNDVVIFDEAYLGLASSDAMTSYNRMLRKMLVTVGQKNLFLILVLPSVFDLAKYCVLHRADGLLHAFKHKGQRGHFAFYNSKRVQQLYIYGKKTYSYWRPKPNFNGRYVKFYPLQEASYRKKKLKALEKFLTDMDDAPVGKRVAMIYRTIQYIKKKNPEMKYQELMEIAGCSKNTIYNALKWVDTGI